MKKAKKRFICDWRYDLAEHGYTMSDCQEGFCAWGLDPDGYDPCGHDLFGFNSEGNFIFIAPDYLAKDLGLDRKMVLHRDSFSPVGFETGKDVRENRYLHFFDNGEILVVYRRKIVTYDSKTNKIRFLRIGPHHMQFFRGFEDYYAEMARRGWSD